MTWFGREPAQALGLVSALIAMVSSTFFEMSIEQQGVLNAAAVAIVGFVTAMAVSGEKAAPLLAGLVQAVLACALAFGLALSQELQGSIMAFVAAGVAWYLRTQVVAPVAAAEVR
jgi:thiamine transporter ThiT